MALPSGVNVITLKFGSSFIGETGDISQTRAWERLGVSTGGGGGGLRQYLGE